MLCLVMITISEMQMSDKTLSDSEKVGAFMS
jgi:hypothetical protein